MIPLLLALTACAPDPKPEGDTGPSDTGASDTAEDSGPDTAEETGETGETAETGTPPTDADGDGHATPESGGDDCDDADPWAFPGATEWCDLVDQDCDGEPLAEGACAGVQELGATTTLVAESVNGFLLERMDTEGGLLLGLYSDRVERPDGLTGPGWGIYAAAPEAWPLSPPEQAGHVWAYGCASYPEEAGDIDGDGVSDLVVSDSLCSYRIVVQRGPVALDGATTWLDESDTWWTSDIVHTDGWAGGLAFGGDFDGDGRNDVVARMQTYDVASDDEFHVFYGGEFGDQFVRVLGPGQAHEQTTLEDLDGDGLSDLLIIDYTGMWFLSGGDLRAADGAWVEDLAIASMWPYQGEAGDLDQAWASVGDWTGDGLSDLAAVGQGAESLGYTHGAVYLFDANIRGEITPDDALGSWVGTDGGEIGGWIRESDMDGDGQAELAVWAETDAGYGTIFLPGGTVPVAYTPVGEAGALRVAAGTPARDGGDLDGDGYDDWLLHDGFFTDSTYVLYGWDVPWGEEPWW